MSSHRTKAVCLASLATMTSNHYAQSLDAGTVEESAQKLFHYERIMQLHLLELRKDSVNMEATYDLVSKSPMSVQTGLRWPPEPNQCDAYMKYMDKICSMRPSSDKE
jgi:hypothetical protein